MTAPVTLRVRGYAASALDTVEESALASADLGLDDAPGLVLLACCYRRRSLRFERAHAGLVADALDDLSDGEDGCALACARSDSEGARMARAARDGLSTLATRARREVRDG